jgi:hypothetical protein
LNKEQELYTFNPKLNENHRVDTEAAEKVILHSTSYSNYVERVRRGVSGKSIHKFSTAPGSASVWKNQLTSPQKNPLFSDKKSESNLNLTVKSLKKVYNN